MVFIPKRLLEKGIIITLLALLFNACKEPEDIGLDVLPAGEQFPIAWVDTFTLKARTIIDDSVVTSKISAYMIGDFGDPIFGRVQSQLFTQVQLPSTNFDFGSGAMLDSIVLNLAYTGSYGHTDKLRGTMKFGVYELSEDLQNDSVYYSKKVQQTAATPIGEVEFRPDLFTEIFLGDDTIPISPSLRIKLDSTFGARILNSTKLASNDVFLEDFKGINIRSQSVDAMDGFGSILYFNLADRDSKIELYYQNDVDTVQLKVKFNLVQEFATHTAFSHEFPVDIVHAITDTTISGANRTYVQSMAGLKTRIEFPFITELNKLGIVAINKAEIIIPLDESVSVEHSVPTSLAATGIKADGGPVFLVDFFEGPSYYGGSYNNEKKEYVFNIARHLQSMLNAPEEIDYGLYILNSGNAVNANRAVFNGPQHATKPMKLRMTYTILE